jgi:ribosomal protein L20
VCGGGQALQASTSAVSYRGRDRRGREKTHLALLSKLVVAHARHIAMSYDATVRPKLETWIEAMRKCVAEDNVELENDGSASTSRTCSGLSD